MLVLMSIWRAGVADLLLGIACAGCGRAGTSWCGDCFREVVPDPFEVEPAVWAAGHWRGALRSAILAWKLGQVTHLDQLMAWHAAAALVASNPPESVVLVPVPTTWRSRRERGRHLVLDLCREMSRLLESHDINVHVKPVVRLRQQTRDQSSLTARQRAANVRGAMKALQRPAHPVIIVDDIVTTGSTMAEMQRALREGGADIAGCVSIAASVRPGENAKNESN